MSSCQAIPQDNSLLKEAASTVEHLNLLCESSSASLAGARAVAGLVADIQAWMRIAGPAFETQVQQHCVEVSDDELDIEEPAIKQRRIGP
mmetsp:Transcript_10260/g.35926  ORF Transcript_10260/g.35926 Transcript_10260/m.35926 type:complete len:90 (+) Transcript_10260:323-592(+)